MGMHITPSKHSLFATVTGISLSGIDDADFKQLLDLAHHRGAIVVREQNLSQAEQVAFARRFGELQKIFAKEALSPEYPELFYVSNVMEGGKPLGSMDAGRFWHTDGAYLKNPHKLSMLYAIEVPQAEGKSLGDTVFADMGAAYDALPEATKQRIEGLRAVHSLYQRYGVKTEKPDIDVKRTEEFPPVSHPVAIRHPYTGRRYLYVSEGYTCGIEGWSQEEGMALVRELCEHSVRPQFLYKHSWAVGDMVIWDNLATMHKATFDYQLPQRRVMRRATVAGVPVG